MLMMYLLTMNKVLKTIIGAIITVAMVPLLSSCGSYTSSSTYREYDTSRPSAYEQYKERQLRNEQLRYYRNQNYKTKK